LLRERLEAAGNTSSAVDAREQKRPASGVQHGAVEFSREPSFMKGLAFRATDRVEDNNIDTGVR
jgi:hypothetical protein